MPIDVGGLGGDDPGAGSVVAIIPARGGSKGIPRKNLETVGGRPLVARAVDAARRAASISRVIVTTDDDAIASAATSSGASIVRRPPELSADSSSSESAVVHALDELGHDPEVTVLVQATSPFLWPDDLDAIVALVRGGDADSAFTATPSHGFLWRVGASGAEGVNHDVVPRKRRQDLEPEYLETGGAYAMRTSGFRTTGHRFFGRIGMVEVPDDRSMEIDTPGDLELARDLAHRIDRRWLTHRLPDPLGAVVFDFDGVLTDNRVLTDQHGNEAVAASRGDGMGIEMLRKRGVPMTVLSKERNPVTSARCAKLGLDVTQGLDRKIDVLQSWLDEREIDPSSVVYVGNDVNDLECVAFVGCGAAVADAHPDLRRGADVVLPYPGGGGAARFLADALEERFVSSDRTNVGGRT